MIAALLDAKGMKTVAARAIGCDQATVHRYVHAYPRVAAALVEARDRMTDVAEMALFDAISGREPWAVALYLKTIGKERGYVERSEQQHSGPDGGPLALTVKVIDDRQS
jgi:hypothetical protein